MDKASLLGDAISYINELRGKMTALESDKETLHSQIEALKKERDARPAAPSSSGMHDNGARCHAVEIEAKILGLEAMIRVQCHKRNHPAAKLMTALRELDLDVYHASVSVVKDIMIQQVAVKMATGSTPRNSSTRRSTAASPSRAPRCKSGNDPTPSTR
ncbi:hypothetical protein ZWY2020_042561 [Hordeum vulgare]|nr:hypothetical protein ZWY2020_042561 [Hordeum vulgare]